MTSNAEKSGTDCTNRSLGGEMATRARPLRTWRTLTALLVLSLLWLGPTLACGSFAPRPTPTPTPLPTDTPQTAATPTAAPALLEPTATFTPNPTATFTPTPQPGTELMVGEPARIAAGGGLNLRETPNTDGELVVRLGFGQRVTVVDGPVSADGYTWWQVDAGEGTVGWAAAGDGTDVWLTPRIGEPQPVNRAPRVGDRVRVTMEANQQLTVRTLPGTDSPVVTRVNPGQEFTVTAGPQSTGGFIWYQIRSDDGSVEGWAADGNDDTRWLSPLE